MTTRPPGTAQTISEPRCEKTELYVSQCAHCRPTPDPLVLDSEAVEHRFEAVYSGHCTICDGPIRAGETIARLTTGGYACTSCCRGLA